MMRRSFLALTGVSAAVGWKGAEAAVQVGRPPSDPARLAARNRDRSAVIAQHGMVCASQPLAALVGIDMLKAGGSCVDAAIATNAALGLMEPASCGIGGDLFAIVWSEKDRKLYGLNASGRAPAAWTLEKAQRTRPPAHPAPEPAVLERARLRQRLAGAQRALRPSRSRPRCSHPRSSTRAPASRSRPSSPRTSAAGATRTSPISPRSSIPAAASRATATSSRTRCWPRPTSASPRTARPASTRARPPSASWPGRASSPAT